MPTEKTLTQWEVDALLNAFTGEAGESPYHGPGAGANSSRLVKNYDFRRPDKLSKEQMRSLKLLYENFARLFGTALSSFLRGAVAIHLTSIEQITYSEYREQLPKPTILYLLGLEPLVGRAVVEMNLPLALAIIDRLLGGPGEVVSVGQNRQNGELSDIEVTLLQTMTGHFTTALQEAWNDIFTVHPKIEDIAFNSELVQAALPNEICVLVILEMKVMNAAGTLSLCMPYTLLEPIVGHLSAQALVNGSFKTARPADPLARQRALHQLEKVTLPVSVRLGTVAVSVSDVLHLEPGDIICLDSPATGALDLLVDGRVQGRVRPGVAGTRIAVRVEEMLAPDPIHLDEHAVPPENEALPGKQ